MFRWWSDVQQRAPSRPEGAPRAPARRPALLGLKTSCCHLFSFPTASFASIANWCITVLARGVAPILRSHVIAWQRRWQLCFSPLCPCLHMPKSWTALGSCIDKVLSLVAIGGIASPLLKIAYSKMNLETDSGDRANDGIAHDEVDLEMQKHVSFHKVAGKKLAASKIAQRSPQPSMYFCFRVCV